MGFGIKSVKLDIESGGETRYVNAPETGPRRTLTRFVGYLGPSGFGLCAAKLIETGHAVAALWIAIMLLVLGCNFLGDGLRDVLDPRISGTTADVVLAKTEH